MRKKRLFFTRYLAGELQGGKRMRTVSPQSIRRESAVLEEERRHPRERGAGTERGFQKTSFAGGKQEEGQLSAGVDWRNEEPS